MAKYIDAEKVIAALTDTLQYEGMVMDELISVVANIPAADVVERKTGKWIKKDCDLLYCSECDLPSLHPWPYCERCGAKMGEKSD